MAKKASPTWVLPLFFISCACLVFLANNLALPVPDYTIILLTCLLEVVGVCLITKKAHQLPLSSLGLTPPTAGAVGAGLVLGVFLYFLQILPPVLLGLDPSLFGSEFHWGTVLLRFLFLTLTIGLSEELVFRGLLFQALERSPLPKVACVLVNCLLFYLLHLVGSLRFDPTHLYSTTVTTVLFCVFLYCSRKKSLWPLIIAHGLYDTLTEYGFLIWNRITG